MISKKIQLILFVVILFGAVYALINLLFLKTSKCNQISYLGTAGAIECIGKKVEFVGKAGPIALYDNNNSWGSFLVSDGDDSVAVHVTFGETEFQRGEKETEVKIIGIYTLAYINATKVIFID